MSQALKTELATVKEKATRTTADGSNLQMALLQLSRDKVHSTFSALAQ